MGQMLGKSQLIKKEPLKRKKKEPLTSLFYFLNKDKGLGANLCPSGLNAQIVCLDQFNVFSFQTFRSLWSRTGFVLEVGTLWHGIRQ